MLRRRFGKLSPQVIVFHRLALSGAPVVGLPPRQPFGNALAQVFGIGEKSDFAGLFERRQGREGRLEFHSIVRGGRFTPGEFAHVGTIAKQSSPTAWSGIAVTCPVSVDRYLFRAVTFRHANKGPVSRLTSRGVYCRSSGLVKRFVRGFLAANARRLKPRPFSNGTTVAVTSRTGYRTVANA